MRLDPDQEQVFATLVEASRQVADRSERVFKLFSKAMGSAVAGVGLPPNGLPVEDDDIDVFERLDLVWIINRGRRGLTRFRVTPEGEDYYAAMKTRAGEPVREVEEDLRSYIESQAFRTRYPAAYKSFAEAERLLWQPDTQEQLTTVGHHAREAMQEFATALVERHHPPDPDPDPAKTVRRLSAVVEHHRPQLGEARSDFLDALASYWWHLNAIVQRQEHGGQKEGEPLIWEDARRVVLHTAVVMVEVARTLDLLAPPS